MLARGLGVGTAHRKLHSISNSAICKIENDDFIAFTEIK